MPSDDRTPAALEALRPFIDSFRQAAAVAAERAEAYLTVLTQEAAQAPATTQLGAFAAGRIDIERFAALSAEHGLRALDDVELAFLRRTVSVLREHASLPDARFVVDVPSGGRLNLALGNTFAELGRAFGAMMVAELIRGGRFDQDQHTLLLHGLPRHRWTRAERGVSPPLVVEIDGADLWAGEIAQFVDGNQKIVLVVRAPAAPVVLTGLVTPGTLVQQTRSAGGVAREVSATAGSPAVVALMPEGSAEFLHLPDSAKPLHERLSVSATPQTARKAVQSWSAWQQDEALKQLMAMAQPPLPEAAQIRHDTADPVDRLASWLMSQANVPAPTS